jgi:integrase
MNLIFTTMPGHSVELKAVRHHREAYRPDGRVYFHIKDQAERTTVVQQDRYPIVSGHGKVRKDRVLSMGISNMAEGAGRKAGVTRKLTPDTLRHCFATHLLDSGTDVRYIQELLGHKDIKTTLVYTHVTTRSLSAIESPLDQLKLGNRFDKNRNDDTENLQI